MGTLALLEDAAIRKLRRTYPLLRLLPRRSIASNAAIPPRPPGDSINSRMRRATARRRSRASSSKKLHPPKGGVQAAQTMGSIHTRMRLSPAHDHRRPPTAPSDRGGPRARRACLKPHLTQRAETCSYTFTHRSRLTLATVIVEPCAASVTLTPDPHGGTRSEASHPCASFTPVSSPRRGRPSRWPPPRTYARRPSAADTGGAPVVARGVPPHLLFAGPRP